MPIVFASRYGDARRSLGILQEMAREEPVSPTAFGLSVHNAIGATYAIARGDRSQHVALAAGAASAAAGVVEAVGLLHDGARQAMVVCYDAPLPAPYDEFHDEPQALYAWAWRLALPAANEPFLRLEARAADVSARDDDNALPFGLAALRFALDDAPRCERTAGAVCWSWQRHA